MPFKLCIWKKWFIFVLALIIALVGGYVLWKVVPGFVENELLLSSRSTRGFKIWENYPKEFLMKFYIFNLTNYEECKENPGKIRPHFQELGPYTFLETHQKNVIGSDQTTLTYGLKKTWKFLPDQSDGTLDTVIFTINPLYITGFNLLKIKNDQVKRHGLEKIFKKNNAQLFINNAVKDLLFDGFDDPALNALKNNPYVSIEYSEDKFGWFYQKNNSVDNFTILNGSDDLKKLGQFMLWNEVEANSFYDRNCSMVNRKSALYWHPLEDKDKTFQIFAPEICSSLSLKKKSKSEIKGLWGQKFVATAGNFDKDHPCFHSLKESGVRKISKCQFGMPLVASYPRFYLSESFYTTTILGIKNADESHEFSITVHPETGIVLDMKAGLQFNLFVPKIKEVPFLANVFDEGMYWPVLWYNQTTELTDETASNINTLIFTLPIIFKCTGYAILVLAVIIGILTPVFFDLNQKYRLIRKMGDCWTCTKPFIPKWPFVIAIIFLAILGTSALLLEKLYIWNIFTLSHQAANNSMFIKVYLFNLTNPKDYEADPSNIKPIFKQCGPYTFSQKSNNKTKNKVVSNCVELWKFFDGNKYKKIWSFLPDKSNGTLDDFIVTVNPSLLLWFYMGQDKTTEGQKERNEYIQEKAGLESMLVNETVNEYLFEGFNKGIMEIIKVDKLNYDDKFAWFYRQNNSQNNDNILTVFTGAKKLDQVNNLEDLKKKIGTGQNFHPIRCGKKIKIYVSDICSVIELEQNGSEVINGVDGDKFIGSRKNFVNNSGSNPKFHLQSAPAGLRSITGCKSEAGELFISNPHFYNSDPGVYNQTIEGMDPQQHLHESFITVHPKTGTVLKAAVRLQFNLYVPNLPAVNLLKNATSVYFPVFWYEQSSEMEELTSSRLFLLFLFGALPIIGYILIAAAIIILVIGIYFKRRSLSTENNLNNNTTLELTNLENGEIENMKNSDNDNLKFVDTENKENIKIGNLKDTNFTKNNLN